MGRDRSTDKIEEVVLCQCKPIYTISPHGEKGFALYFGRCPHKHGNRVGMLTEFGDRTDIVELIALSLNGKEWGT